MNADGPRVAAIHQPNFLPRLSTLAKIYCADVWIVLDDVQYCQRDYQNRARLSPLGDPDRARWLTLPVHRPHGRSTLINEVLLADPKSAQRQVCQTLDHLYGRSPSWPRIRDALGSILKPDALSERIAEVAFASTKALLRLLAWQGHIAHSGMYQVEPERSARLADLCQRVGATTYLCGTGGRSYLQEDPFRRHGVRVDWFSTPNSDTDDDSPVWASAARLSAIWSLATHGTDEVRSSLQSLRSRDRIGRLSG